LCGRQSAQALDEPGLGRPFQHDEPPGIEFAVVRRAGGQMQQVRQLAVVGARGDQGLGGAGAPMRQQGQGIRRRFDRIGDAELGRGRQY
jgi:hypothetical protein